MSLTQPAPKNRKQYGNSWWGAAWVKAMEDLGGERLKRGKTYANTGKVSDLKYENGKIIAKVAGNYQPFYRVEIELSKLTASDIKIIEAILEENPLIAADLSLGKLSSNLEQLSINKGIYLLPYTWSEIRAKCNCPDYGDPCKHQAAVVYMMANELDKDPLNLLRLRGLAEEFFQRESISNTDTEKTLEDIISKICLSPEQISDSPKDYNQKFSSLDFKMSKLLELLSDSPSFETKSDFKRTLKILYEEAAYKINKLLLRNLDSERDIRKKDYKLILNTEAKSYPQLFSINCLSSKENIDLNSLLDEFLYFSLNENLNELFPRQAFLTLLIQLSVEIIKSGMFIPEVIFDRENSFTIRYLPLAIDDGLQSRIKILSDLCPHDLIETEEKELIKSFPAEDTLGFFISILIHQAFADSELNSLEKITRVFISDYKYLPNNFSENSTGKGLSNWLSKLLIQKQKISSLIRIEAGSETNLFLHVDIANREQPFEAVINLRDLYLSKKKSFFSLPKEEIKNIVNKQLAIAAEYIPELNLVINSKGENAPELDLKRISELLLSSKFILELLGIQFVLPKALQKILRPNLSISAKSKNPKSNSALTMDKLLDFSYEISLGENKMSLSEFKKLVKSSMGLVKFNDQYVMLDPAEIEKLLKQSNKPLPQLNSSMDLLHYGLNGEINGIKINSNEDLDSFIEVLTKQEKVKLPSNLKAELRPYQERGFKWLYSNFKKNLGSCIADDMGLGKTLQVITLLLKVHTNNASAHPSLVICPTTLIGNWVKECAKFAADLKVSVYHGAERNLSLKNVDIVISSYGILRRDLKKFSKHEWNLFIIDEAQNIKNTEAQQTKAIKSLKAKNFIAMSGTPVENRLSELWSIFDFINPGYLKSLQEFNNDFALPIERYRDETAAERLRKVTSPFLLRRLKTDKKIIKDLPDKIITDEFNYLSKEQSVIYQSIVETIMEDIESSEGIARKGLIFKLITNLKQLCNHPSNYTKQKIYDVSLSGKAMKLISLLNEIIANKEKVIIFTQYSEMGYILQEMIKEELSLEAVFFHGAISRKKRDQMVEDFQNKLENKIMIISLKAGGTGLNLTAANHVIHYDLWWNPAVENQATDRCFRIGQSKNVFVHRFISLGTFEEKINEIIKAKQELADLSVSAGENWISEMSNKELKDIFKISQSVS